MYTRPISDRADLISGVNTKKKEYEVRGNKMSVGSQVLPCQRYMARNRGEWQDGKRELNKSFGPDQTELGEKPLPVLAVNPNP